MHTLVLLVASYTVASPPEPISDEVVSDKIGAEEAAKVTLRDRFEFFAVRPQFYGVRVERLSHCAYEVSGLVVVRGATDVRRFFSCKVRRQDGGRWETSGYWTREP
jgi:hypothetical protein